MMIKRAVLLLCLSGSSGVVRSWTVVDPAQAVERRSSAPSSDDCSPPCRRRAVLQAAASLALVPTVAFAAEDVFDVGEVVRKSAANLPGLGPADVSYPPLFQGLWNVKRQVSFDDDNDKSTVTLEYKVRFLATKDAVVADRGYNQANLERAIRRTMEDDSIQSVVWKVTNPNDLSMVFRNGSQKDIKVTKRASDMTDTTVSSSEFQRVTSVATQDGIPQVTARRVLTKYKVVDPNQIEGLEIVYNAGIGGDPLSLQISASQQQQQILLSKSRLLLERES
jgi:hypothetical protein